MSFLGSSNAGDGFGDDEKLSNKLFSGNFKGKQAMKRPRSQTPSSGDGGDFSDGDCKDANKLFSTSDKGKQSSGDAMFDVGKKRKSLGVSVERAGSTGKQKSKFKMPKIQKLIDIPRLKKMKQLEERNKKVEEDVEEEMDRIIRESKNLMLPYNYKSVFSAADIKRSDDTLDEIFVVSKKMQVYNDVTAAVNGPNVTRVQFPVILVRDIKLLKTKVNEQGSNASFRHYVIAPHVGTEFLDDALQYLQNSEVGGFSVGKLAPAKLASAIKKK